MQQPKAPHGLFNNILKQLQAHETEQAVISCRAALATYPDDINILALLGAALGDLRRYEEAEAILTQAIELAPTFSQPYVDLGSLLAQQQRVEEAIPLLEKALRLDDKLEEAHFQLGKAFAQLGHGAAADAAFERSFALSPVRHSMTLAAQHHQAGELQEAEKLCRQVLQQKPQHVDAMRMLGLIAAAAGDLYDAEHLLRQVLSLAPDHAPALFELGRVLRELDRPEDAIEVYQRLTELQPENPKAHYRLAGVLAPSAMNAEAAKAYQRALELEPNYAAAWLGLGHMHKTLGRPKAAIAAYQQCLALEPDFGEAYYSLANLKTYAFTDETITAMEQRIDQDGVKETSQVNFLFALAKAYDDRLQFDRAWHYYSRGNTQQRTLVSYDPVMTETVNDELVDFFTKAFFESLGSAGNPDTSPIFILGLPRSGSTLVEQILASHSQIEGTSELPYIGRLSKSLNHNRADGQRYPGLLSELEPRHFARLGARYLEMAQRHRVEGTPFFIDKMPNNFPSVGFIHAILPNARIIDARRQPLDACVGNIRQLYARGQTFTYDICELAEYYLQYQRMMDHWETVLPGKVLKVQYEDTVADLESQVKRILLFLHLPLELDCLEFHNTARAIRTASSEQVRQPIYKTGVGYWRNYEAQLEELREILEPVL